MRPSIVHLTFVEMRRALHRRLVRWMVLLAVALSALTGVIIYVTSRDPVALAREAQPPGPHGVMVGPSKRRPAAHRGDVPCRRRRHLRRISGRRRMEGGHDHDGTDVGAGAPASARSPHRLGGDPGLRHRSRPGGRVPGLAALPAVVLNGESDGTTGAWWVGLVLAMTRLALITSLVAVLAVSIATIGRNTSAALIAMAAWALVVERIVAVLRPQLARFMIGENVATVIPWSQLTGVDFERPPIAALAALFAYLAAVIAVAAVSFARRDVIAV